MYLNVIYVSSLFTWATIKSKEKIIEYYDSLYDDKEIVVRDLMDWLEKEHVNRKNGLVLNRTDWQLVQMNDVPRQQNGNDCGVFALAFAEILSRGLIVSTNSFSQREIRSFRQQIQYDIVRLWKMGAIQ
jgi:sentrin-specific protease 1